MKRKTKLIIGCLFFIGLWIINIGCSSNEPLGSGVIIELNEEEHSILVEGNFFEESEKEKVLFKITSDTVVLDKLEENVGPFHLRKKDEIKVWIPNSSDKDDTIPAEKIKIK